MLVIAAVYDSALRYLLDDEYSVRLLFDRTIKLLRVYEGVSPTIKNDLRILLYVRAQLFLPQISRQPLTAFDTKLGGNCYHP